VLGDKAYDSNAIRRQIEDQRAVPNIPWENQSALQELLLA
jgi:hypothetical protein